MRICLLARSLVSMCQWHREQGAGPFRALRRAAPLKHGVGIRRVTVLAASSALGVETGLSEM